MAEYGIQSDGEFRRKHIDTIEESLVSVAEEEFGEDVDLAPGSPHRQLIELATIELANLWESLEGTYYSAYFPDAMGVQLDRILSLAGVSRLQRRGATGEVRFVAARTPEGDITIPSGTRVTTPETDTSPRIPFATTAAATIRAGETAGDGPPSADQVPIRALEPWETNVSEAYLGASTNVDSNTITRISDPIAGVSSVTNPLPTGDSGTREDGTSYTFVTGRDRESDSELKQRYENSMALGGQASLEAIRSSVYNASDAVETVTIEENNTMQDNTESGGLPPKSFRITAFGGDPDDIAQAITDTRSAGIRSYGAESGTGYLQDGSDYEEGFDRAKEVRIHVDVDLFVEDTFPNNGVDIIENNIIGYIGGENADGQSITGTAIGQTVRYDLVFSAAMNARGVYSADVDIGGVQYDAGGNVVGNPDPTMNTADVDIEDDEVARTLPDLIDISYTVGEI